MNQLWTGLEQIEAIILVGDGRKCCDMCLLFSIITQMDDESKMSRYLVHSDRLYITLCIRNRCGFMLRENMLICMEAV